MAYREYQKSMFGKKNQEEAAGCSVSRGDIIFHAVCITFACLAILGTYLYYKGEEIIERACDSAFDEIDNDKSGKIDATELQMGIIMVRDWLDLFTLESTLVQRRRAYVVARMLL